MTTIHNYPAGFKAAVALAAHKEEQSPAELAARFGVTPELVLQWQQELIDGAAHAFSQQVPVLAENKVPDSKDLAFVVAENATQGLAMMDDRGYCIYANRAWLTMTGYSAQEIGSRPLHELVHHHYPDGRPYPRSACPIERALREHVDVRSHEDVFFRKDGSRFAVMCAASPIFEQGRPVATIIEIRDITERKRTEAQERQAAAEAAMAAEANAKFQTFFEQGTYFAGLMTLDGTLIEANRLCLDMCGYTRDDVIGKKFWDGGWWNRSAALMDMVKIGTREAAAGRLFRRETSYYIADGSERIVDLVIAPVTNDAGDVLYIAPTGVDITERKLVEERLRMLDAMSEVTRAAVDAKAVMEATTRLLGMHMGVTRCAYADLEADNDQFTIRQDWTEEGAASSVGVYSLDLFGPKVAADMREGRTLVVCDVDRELAAEEGADMFNAIGIKAIICCPLVKQGRLVAMMAVHQDRPRRWSQDDIALVEEVVDRSWAHIERVRATEVLRHSEMRSANALAIAQLGTFEWDMRSNAVVCSDRTREIFGFGEEEGSTAADYFARIHPDDVERVRCEIEAAMASDGKLRTEYRIRIPNGEERHVVSLSACQRDSDGHWCRHVGVFSDITERKQAEAALRESQAHLSSMLEQTSAGIAETDLEGRFLGVNDRYCEILGRSRADLMGCTMQELTHPDDLPRNLVLFQNMIQHGTPFEIEKRYLRPDGSAVWASTTVSLIRNASDKSRDVVLAVVVDTTERKHAEEKLKEADRRKDEFLAMLAHELRNPLAPIKAAADMMQMVKLDEERIRKTSDIIARQVRHMASLVDDLLDVSRVTRGLVTLEKTALDAKRIVADAVEQVRPLTEARRHHLALHLPPQPAFIYGDRKRMVQVMANLLTNAAKYTPEGGNITLSMEVSGDRVQFAVTDNGIGMTEELIARSFELFTQGERTSDRSQGGLGIGLALVKSLLELHGGSIAAHSEGIGRGSQFVACLPRMMEPVEGVRSPQFEGKPHSAIRALTVMVVDDNVDAAQMLAMFLEELGHRVLVEHSSTEALGRARSEIPDVLLLDIGLPDMDGNELARRLRSQPETTDAVLVAVTGYGQENDRRNAFDAGFDHHFVKPVDTASIAALLDDVSNAAAA